MIHPSIATCIGKTPMVHLARLFPSVGCEVLAKLELLNPAGSVKDRPARFIIEQGLQDNTITAQTHLIESSSGNLGIALATIAKIYGLTFTCVVDPKISPTNLKILRQLDAQVEIVQQRDDQGGYQKTRILRVQELCQTLPNSLWINQYANRLNWQAHYYGVGQEILEDLEGRHLDGLVIAVSTTGTIRGTTLRLKEVFPRLRVVAVDAIGSVIFGTAPAKRELPGIGSSWVPALLDRSLIDEVVQVSDREAAQGCRSLVKAEGILAGGSSGSVVAALQKLLPTFPPGYRVVTLFPDRGDRYLDLVYDDDWMAQLPARSGEWLKLTEASADRISGCQAAAMSPPAPTFLPRP